MDTKPKPPINLAATLSSYKVLVISIVLLFGLGLFIYGYNNASFNKLLGNELFVMIPFLFIIIGLIREFIFIKNDPAKSSLMSFSWFKTWYNDTVMYPDTPSETFISKNIGYMASGFIALLVISVFFMILSVGGVFSDKPPENNTAVVITCVIFLIYIIVTASLYFKTVQKDETIFTKLSPKLQNVYNMRSKYTMWLVLFMLGMTGLYFLNPWDIMSTAGGPVIFFTLFVGVILGLMITFYQYYLADPAKEQQIEDNIQLPGMFIKGLYIIGALGISIGLIYGALKMMGVFDEDAAKPESWGHIIFNLLIFCALLSILYRLANAGGFLNKNPYYRLALNTILYIPCLIVYAFYGIAKLFGFMPSVSSPGMPGTGAMQPPSKFEIKMLVLSLVLLSSYFFWFFYAENKLKNNYLTQGGQQLINQPVPLNVLNNIASFDILNGEDVNNYQFAISFWFYLDAFPPNANASYLKIAPILSYGDNPAIKYSSSDNTIYVTANQNDEFFKPNATEMKIENSEQWKKWKEAHPDKETATSSPVIKIDDIDAEGRRIVYRHPNVLLQKWNHIVLNYNGGTLDIFYNGQLVKSAIEVVPYVANKYPTQTVYEPVKTDTPPYIVMEPKEVETEVPNQVYDMLSVGSENGANGNIANLMFFKAPLDILTIYTLYNSLKTSNPPSIPDDNKQIVPLPDI
jgi:hypothetical protein